MPAYLEGPNHPVISLLKLEHRLFQAILGVAATQAPPPLPPLS